MSSERPTGRFISAFVDFIVWALTMGAATWTIDTVVRAGLGWPSPAPVDSPRDTLSIVSVGCAALCANVGLAAFAASGRSPGKALLGLRLVTVGSFEKPGWARGLVRSSLQAGPYMGAFSVLTGLHDRFAGTSIIRADERRDVGRATDELDMLDDEPDLAEWRVGVALLLHAFFAFVFMLIAAL